jgi:hypothetical protein
MLCINQTGSNLRLHFYKEGHYGLVMCNTKSLNSLGTKLAGTIPHTYFSTVWKTGLDDDV